MKVLRPKDKSLRLHDAKIDGYIRFHNFEICEQLHVLRLQHLSSRLFGQNVDLITMIDNLIGIFSN